MGAIVLFSDNMRDHAAVYLHGDDGDVPEQLEEFFRREDVRMAAGPPRYDNRFDDPSYLAARFVVHAMQTSSGTGVGVTVPSERDESNYRVICTQQSWPRVATL